MTVRSTNKPYVESVTTASATASANRETTKGRQRIVPEDWLNSISPIQHGSGTAAWLQIRSDLFMRISNGILAPGDELPSEPALANAYTVSRLTMRRALEDLARAGYIRTDHGVGSYVAPAMMRHRIDDGNASLFESMAELGHTVRQLVLTARDLRLSQRRAPEHLSISRGLDEPDDLEFAEFPGMLREYYYVRWVDDIPWSLSYALIPASLAPRAWDGAVSLFEEIANLHGLVIHRHERRFSAVPAEEDDARWLEVPMGSPLLLLNGTNTDQHGRAVARVVHHIRGDRAQYAVRIPT